MNKVIIFGSALLCSTLVSNAAWVSGGGAKSSEKSVSSLASLVEERSVVLGNLKSTAETKAASLGALSAPVGGSAASKAISIKWKDSASGLGLSEVNSELVLAKNDSGDVPEAGTWAGAAVVALVAVGGWKSKRVRS